MKLPSSDIRQAIYTSLSTLGRPVNSGTHQLWVTPCYYIGNIVSIQDDCKGAFGSDNDIIVESIVDFDGTNGSWQQVDDYASEASVQLTTQPLTLSSNYNVNIRLVGSNQVEEDLSNGKLRYRRIMNFRILLQQI
jgi:hypothetical protein